MCVCVCFGFCSFLCAHACVWATNLGSTAFIEPFRVWEHLKEVSSGAELKMVHVFE